MLSPPLPQNLNQRINNINVDDESSFTQATDSRVRIWLVEPKSKNKQLKQNTFPTINQTLYKRFRKLLQTSSTYLLSTQRWGQQTPERSHIWVQSGESY